MTVTQSEQSTLQPLDEATRELVRLAVVIAAGSEPDLRAAMARAVSRAVDPTWVEELILQSYLFAGFPRTLNAAREWRRVSGKAAPSHDEGADYNNCARWRERGEETCATVYGATYERLRANVRELHPALDTWMIVDGYGKVLGRPGLDLKRRELCVVAVCAALRQERQLHAHLHGALNSGATPAEVNETLQLALEGANDDVGRRFQRLWTRVGKHA
jgi:4-carboxymuconolactone decarboxylase